MGERLRYFAIVPIHGRNAFVEGQTGDELNAGIDEVLLSPEKSYPDYNFRAEITVIKGRKVKLPRRRK